MIMDSPIFGFTKLPSLSIEKESISLEVNSSWYFRNNIVYITFFELGAVAVL